MVSTLVTHIMSSVYRVRLSLPPRDSLPNQPSVNSTILTLILLISGDPVSVGDNTNTLMSVGHNTNTLMSVGHNTNVLAPSVSARRYDQMSKSLIRIDSLVVSQHICYMNRTIPLDFIASTVM